MFGVGIIQGQNTAMTSLQIFNTLHRQKEPFKPLTPNEVKMYVCGVTVYDRCHIGHARAYVVFDTIRRYLENSGYTVTYVQNFTDIDDKIIRRANEAGITTQELTRQTIADYFTDMAELNIKPATIYPKATESIPEMHAMITTLIENGCAYPTPDGHVYFAVNQFKDYGKLSGKVLDDLIAGHRVEVSDSKQNPGDFVLWKPAKPGEPSWESPWGAGRPGWHIECSAMAAAALGKTIDIHGGGEDLIFPHHENEIAQSECTYHQPFANYWVHNGFVTIDNEKMSKSLKNFVSLRDILDQFDGQTIRFFLQKAHYRSPINFSDAGLTEAKTALNRLKNTALNAESSPPSDGQINALNQFENRFTAAMNDDFNTAEAIGVLFDLNKFINTEKTGQELLVKLCGILGLTFSRETFGENELANRVETLIDERNLARKNKDFKRADEIRNQLLGDGIALEDTADGTRWHRV